MAAPSDWPLLSEAMSRLDALSIAAAHDIIGRGQVRVTAIRSDTPNKTPEPVAALLAEATRTKITIMTDDPTAILEFSADGTSAFLPMDSEIAAYFDRRDCAILGPRSILPRSQSDVEIKFFRARVHWSSLVDELKAVGLLADAIPDSATAELEPDLPKRAEAFKAFPAEANEGAKATAAEAESPEITDSRLAPPPKRHRGPQPGAVSRYHDADRALFPHIAGIMQKDRGSAFAAASKLAEGRIEGVRVEGAGTPRSRAQRLATLYLKDKRKSGLTETR